MTRRSPRAAVRTMTNKGLTHMVMDGGVEAYAVGASDEMATVGGVEMVRPALAQCVQAASLEPAISCGGPEEEIEGEGGDVGI